MENSLNNVARKFYLTCSLATTVLLQSCAIPGFSEVASLNETHQSQHLLGYAPVTEISPDQLDNYAEQARLIPINSSLIRAQIAKRPTGISSELANLIGKSAPYTIGISDVIGVVVYDHPELLPNAGAVISQSTDPTGISAAPGFIVDANGEIAFPYIGRIKISGLTEIEASNLISSKISEYIKSPQVTVRIQSFRSRRTYIEGEVKSPGIQIFTDVPMTLAEAISRAGGITSLGDRSSVLLTRSGQTTVIDLSELRKQGIDATRIPLLNGDSVYVRSREERKVYVMGEILKPSALVMRDGRLSLNEALGEAGGPNLATSNPGQIYVIRNNENRTAPLVYHLDAKNPVALALADQFELTPRDVVYIDPVPLVKWNRVLTLILPSAQIVNLGSQTVTR